MGANRRAREAYRRAAFLNHVRPGSWPRDLAFSIGGSYVPERVTKADWEAFSSELRMPARRVLERLADRAGRMPELAAEARETLAREHGDERVFDALEESVRRRLQVDAEVGVRPSVALP